MEDLKPAISPRAGAIVRLGENWAVKLFWSNAFRAPSLNELTIDAPSQKGNIDLDPETIETWDASISYSGRNLYVAGNVFHSQLRGIIQPLPTSDLVPGMNTPVLRYQNARNFGLVGAGCEIKDYLTPEWLVTGSFNYQESFDDQEWDLLPVPPYIGKLGASYRSPNDWDAGILTVYAGEYADRFVEETLNPAPEASIQADANGRIGLSRWFGNSGRVACRSASR